MENKPEEMTPKHKALPTILIAGICIIGVIGLFILRIVYYYDPISAIFMGFFRESSNIIEIVTRERPQIKVNAYLEAIKDKDEDKAMSMWKTGEELQKEYKYSIPEDFSSFGNSDIEQEIEKERRLLRERRESITKELITMEIKDFDILSTEWWEPVCCEYSAHITNRPRDADTARMRVQIIDREENNYIYIFDIGTREPYDVVGSPPRKWVIRDIYPEGEKPIFFQKTSD